MFRNLASVKLTNLTRMLCLMATCGLAAAGLAGDQKVTITGTNFGAYCYNVCSTSGYVTARINGRDVGVKNVKVQIKVGQTTMAEATTNASGYYFVVVSFGEKLVGDKTYVSDLRVTTPGYSGIGHSNVKVMKAPIYTSFATRGRPLINQRLAVDLYLKSSLAPVGQQKLSTSIGEGRTDAKGHLELFFTPRKGSNKITVNYSGNDYVQKIATYYIVNGV